MDIIPDHIIPIAILSSLIFGEKDEELLGQLKELGILHMYDDSETDTDPLNLKRPQLTRSISINANGRIEVERQFQNGIEKFSILTRTQDPLKIEALDKETFIVKEKDIKLSFQLRDVELHGVNNYLIKGVKSLSKSDWARITFDLPNIVRLSCRYQIQGMVLGKNVHDSGNTQIKLTGVQIDGKVKVNVTDEAINVLHLDLSYSFDDLFIEKIGLMLAGMRKESITKLFSETSKKYLTENMTSIAERISKEMKDKLNERLKNISGTKIVRSMRYKNDEEKLK